MAKKVSILGAAGTLGSCAAYEIATQGLADELVLLDKNEKLLKCHMMDIQTALTGIQDTAVREGGYSDLAESDVVVVAAGAPWRLIGNRMELLGDSLPIIKSLTEQIFRFCPQAVVITATNPVDPLNYAMHRISGMDRKKLLGYSLNDSFRFRLIVARLLRVASTKVEGLVVGEHGPHQVILFSTLRVDGRAADLNEEQKRSVCEEIPKALAAFERLQTGRTSGWTSAVGLSAMVAAILGDTGAVFPASVVLEGEYGYRGLSASLPVALGRTGWRDVVKLKMTPSEADEFAASADYLNRTARIMDDLIEKEGATPPGATHVAISKTEGEL